MAVMCFCAVLLTFAVVGIKGANVMRKILENRFFNFMSKFDIFNKFYLESFVLEHIYSSGQ
jgi:hypothetical protein